MGSWRCSIAAGRHRDCKGVEISYAILRRDLLDRLPDHDLLIEEALYPAAGAATAAGGARDRSSLLQRRVARAPAVDGDIPGEDIPR